MFANNDNIILSVSNARNIKGYSLPFYEPLPIKNEINKDLFSEIVAIDVTEYQEGYFTGGFIPFSIYVGKVKPIKEILVLYEDVKINDNLNISSINDLAVYQEVEGKVIIFDIVKSNDKVVADSFELMGLLNIISEEFLKIKSSTQRIKTLSLGGK